MKLKTIDELFNEIELTPETELTKKFNEKEQDKLEKQPTLENYGNFGELIGEPRQGNTDTSENYGLAIFGVTHDPSHRGGIKGCAYTSQVQIVKKDNLEKVLVENYKYRDIGNSPFDHRKNFSKGRIIEENQDKLLYGLESHETIEFHEVDTRTKKDKLVELVDLDYKRKNEEKLEKFDKAFKELDEDSIKTFIEERHMFTTIKKINDDYAIAMLYDPYADTGSRHAKTKLIVKDKGIIDLKHHEKKFSSSAVTQGFDIENIKMMYDGENILLDYVIAEEESGHSSTGSYWKNTLGTTKQSIELNQKELGMPVTKDMSIDYIIEKEKQNILSHGNLNEIPIHMEGFSKDKPTNYAYNLEKIEHNNKNYLVVSKVIDMLQYRNTWGGANAVEMQINTTVYEIDEKQQKLEEITSSTTDTNDRKKYELDVNYNSNTNEMTMPTPQIDINDKEITINYKVTGNNFDKKEVKLKIN